MVDKPNKSANPSRGGVEQERELHESLRKAFNELANEPIPDRFEKLLIDLENREKGKNKL